MSKTAPAAFLKIIQDLDDERERQNRIVATIAKKQLHIESLECQLSNSRDVHELHVTMIEQALISAFETGKLIGRISRMPVLKVNPQKNHPEFHNSRRPQK